MTKAQTPRKTKVRSDSGVKDPQTFCLYCQKEYGTEPKLKAHLRRVHVDTYAQHALAPMPGHPKESHG